MKSQNYGWFKIALLLLFAAGSLAITAGAATKRHYPAPKVQFVGLKHAGVWVGFSPNAGAQKLVLATIAQAKHTLLVEVE